MTHFKTASLAFAVLAFANGAAFAQTNSTGSMSSSDGMSTGGMSTGGAMSTGGMSTGGAMSSSQMSKADMAAMKHCQAMSHDMMIKNAKCMKMMKMHPDMMGANPPMGH